MKAMVLAAGLGTRFRPVTDALPKPLVPLCNRPIVGWAIDALIGAGVSEIVVNLHHQPEPLRAWLEAEYEGRCLIRYSFEPEILGTGGGLRKARRHFEDEELFLLVNGDSVQFPPLAELIAAMRTTGAVAAMLLRHPPRDDRFTSVWFDGIRVTAIGGDGTGEPLMFSGVHALTPEVFERLPDRDVSGMTEDFYVPLLESGDRAIAGIVHDGLWFDVGSPLRYMQASRELTAAIVGGAVRPPSGSSPGADAAVIHERGRIEGQVSKSVVGANARIGARARVDGSAIWDGAVVGAGAVVASSIVGTAAVVPPGAELHNALLWNGTVIAIDPSQPLVADGLQPPRIL